VRKSRKIRKRGQLWLPDGRKGKNGVTGGVLGRFGKSHKPSDREKAVTFEGGKAYGSEGKRGGHKGGN